MKRSLKLMVSSVVLPVAVLFANSCTVSNTVNSNAAAVTNGNTNAPLASANSNANASAAATGGALAAELTAKEKQLWDTLKNRDYDAFDKMLSSDSVYISSDVVSGKAGTVNGVKNFAPTEINLSDWKTVMLGEDAGVVTYTVKAKGTSGGQPIPEAPLRASTAWVKRGAEWVAVFHQDCPVEDATAAPQTAETSKPASAASASNANAASATKPAETGAANDPLAKEKQTWDALKRKDWEAFAANLAEDQLEVEPSGVYDKAATLAAVKQFDFSKASTSDFKATKLDDDATLVTYMVRAPGPDGKMRDERASTIWVNRGGAWLAVFHQGTPVMQMPAK
jgi:hypothetical protein